MAGSRRRFRYESDNGSAYSLTLDESNGEAIITAGARITDDLVSGELSKPAGFSPRYVLAYLQSNPLIRRRFVVGDPAAVSGLTATGATMQAAVYALADDTTPPKVAWVVTAYRGEKLSVVGGISAPDTGLDEADA